MATVDSAQWLLRDVLRDLRHTEEVLSLVGLCYVGKLTLTTAWEVAQGLCTHVWARWSARNLPEEYGRWAVVVGGMAGVGRDYVSTLASHGVNVLLVDCTAPHHQQYTSDLSRKHGVQVVAVQANHSTHPDTIRQLLQKDIGILVNCFEIGVEQEIKDETQMVEVLSGMAESWVAVVTRMVVPAMVARRRGAVVDVYSVNTISPAHLWSLYSRVQSFGTRTVALELTYNTTNLTLQTVVLSKMNMMEAGDHCCHFAARFSNAVAATCVTQCAWDSLATLGYTSVTMGSWKHSMMAWIIEKLPSWTTAGILVLTYKFIIRNRL